MITDEEYEAVMDLRERTNLYNESMDSKLMQLLTDFINRIAYSTGKEYFSQE